MGSIKTSKKWRKKWEKELKMYEEYESINNQELQSFQDYINNDEYYNICYSYQLLKSSYTNVFYISNFQKIEDTDFPISFLDAYQKVINQNHNTIDIITEIFIVSLAHSVYFGEYNQEKTILYSGSLIQQTRSESFIEHGYIHWSLLTKTSNFHRVHNPYGQLTISIELNTDEQQVIIEEKGSIVLPAKVFAELLRKLPGKEVEIENLEFKAFIGKKKLKGTIESNYQQLNQDFRGCHL